jgi:hypothetical protein
MYVIIDAARGTKGADRQPVWKRCKTWLMVCKIAQIVYGYFLAIAMACFAYIFHGS